MPAANITPLCEPDASVSLKLNHAYGPQVWCCSATLLPSTHSSIFRSCPNDLADALKLVGEVAEPLGAHILIPSPACGKAQPPQLPPAVVFRASAKIVEVLVFASTAKTSGLVSKLKSPTARL